MDYSQHLRSRGIMPWNVETTEAEARPGHKRLDRGKVSVLSASGEWIEEPASEPYSRRIEPISGPIVIPLGKLAWWLCMGAAPFALTVWAIWTVLP